MEPEISLQRSQEPTTDSSTEPDASIPQTSHPVSQRSILILSVVSSFQALRPKFCIHFSFIPCVLHAPPI